MAKQYTAIKRKVEDAIEALINKFSEGVLDDVTFYKGFDFSKAYVTPRLHIVVRKATPQITGDTLDGNWQVEIEVTIVSHYVDTTRAEHELMIGVVEDIFMRTDIADLINNLNSIQNFTVFDGLYGFEPGEGSDTVEEKEFRSMYTATMVCSPTTFEKQ